MPQDPRVIIFGFIIAFLGSVIAAALVYLASRAKNRNESRRDTVADRDGLIASFQTSVNILTIDVGKLRTEVSLVREHNEALSAYIYRLVGVLRRNNMTEHIPEPVPDGIHL